MKIKSVLFILIWIIYIGLPTMAAKGKVKPMIQLSSGAHLFIDDFLISKQSNLKRRINQPQRLPQPVVTGDEDKCFQPYVTVVRDPDTKKFRVWYGVPENASQTHLAYMESDDGIDWIRPHRVLKDAATISFGASIIDEGPNYSDTSKRYKYGWWGESGLKIAKSANGMNWSLLAPGVVLQHNHDINSIHWDPIRKRYIALVSSYTTGEKWTGNRRIPMQSVSDDLIHWKEPWRIIEPDEKDEGETQFYCMSGVIARGDLLIGTLKVLRDEVIAEGAPTGAFGVGYTTLAWSRDGEHWERDREAFMPRNPEPGTWDHAMTWADCQLPVGDEIYIYYGGYAWGHKWERFTQRQIGLARIPLDRYVSRDAWEERGTLLTPIITIDSSKMTVNAKVNGGLQIRILDESDKPIPGFDWTDCKVIQGDSIRHHVQWKKSLSTLIGKPIRLEFAMRNAQVYGFAL